MTEEEIEKKFKETYPGYMRGDTPLSPYFDIFCYGIEIMEQETDKLLYWANERQKEQIEKMKNCWNCKNWNWKHAKCQKKLKGDCFKASKWELKE